jgi:hypothetical protein
VGVDERKDVVMSEMNDCHWVWMDAADKKQGNLIVNDPILQSVATNANITSTRGKIDVIACFQPIKALTC